MKKKIKKLKLIIAYLLMISAKLSFSQTIISGIILSHDEKPIENVTILLKNTTIYSESDFNGLFTITIPPNVVESDLYLSRVGYNDTTINYNYLISDKIIFLNSSGILNEVVVKKKKSFLLKNQLKQIETSLIGTNYYSKFCEIQNLDSFIILTNKDHSFNYYSNEFITVVNRALGYKIKARLGMCSINGISKSYNIKSVQYLPLVPSSEKEKIFYEKNREKIFSTTSKGFFTALAIKTYEKDFIIYKKVTEEPLTYPMFLGEEIKNKNLILVSPDSIIITKFQEERYHFSFDKPLFVFLKKESSDNNFFYDIKLKFFICDLLRDSMTFDKYGNTFLPFSFIVPDNTRGYFERLIPKDYLPSYLK
jgi:hypothetical protein